MTEVAGLDGYRKGWVAVVLADGTFARAEVFASFREALEGLSEAAAIGVDIPIGLPTTAHRTADVLARRFVKPRHLSVFSTPQRDVFQAPSYEEARRISVERYGRSIASQSYRGLRHKLLEVDALVEPGSTAYEVHPEVSFRGLAGHPLAFPKKSWNGQMERRALLGGAGIVIPDHLDDAGHVPVDDVLDAAVVAWSTARIALGLAQSLPSPPETDDRGRRVAIWW